ncbi:hypothetical protein [Leuconostoc pseudomesenteroides]|uniref:hypothetical protein n=1 Tax=Leuconostoc pseudomesenteroides TaxID=33968 RepID=UPI0039EAD6C5
MYRVKNITSGTWVKEYIVGKWLKETIETEDAGIFEKSGAEKLARMLSDEDVKYKAVQLPVEGE